MLFGDDMQDSRSPLSGRVVCMLGSFTQSNAVMQRKLREQGADYKPSTRMTALLCVKEPSMHPHA